MPLGNQHTQSPGREEESRGDKETPNLPEDAQGSPVPFENSTFNISGTSQLGLSFGKISADEDQNQSKSQSSLFDDEHDGMFEVRRRCKNNVSQVIHDIRCRRFV